MAGPAAAFLPAFRIAIELLPESNIVAVALSQPAFLGLKSDEAQRLQSLCAARYQMIHGDAVFAGAPSLLPYCYSQRTPTNGLALMYVPRKSGTNTPVLLFLHGYGGSFLWTQHLLAEAFPDHLILCPAYGQSCAMIPSAYVAECMVAAERELRHPIPRPTLMGLSAGGFGATRVCAQLPDKFARLVVLAAYPPQDAMTRFSQMMPAYFVAGARESYVQSGEFQRSVNALRPRVKTLEYRVLPNADHFFLLEKKDETFRILRQWLN
jgi:pimeloyl-ACP methyl ester carboxylesterase